MNHELTIRDDRVIFANGKVVTFSKVIAQHVMLADRIILRLKQDSVYPDMNEVFAYDLVGNLLWQIQPTSVDEEPYYGITWMNGRLLAIAYGEGIEVDLDTGKELNRFLAK